MIEERSPEVVKTLEIVELIEGEPKKVTMVGANLDPSMKGEIMEFLKKNLDVFPRAIRACLAYLKMSFNTG